MKIPPLPPFPPAQERARKCTSCLKLQLAMRRLGRIVRGSTHVHVVPSGRPDDGLPPDAHQLQLDTDMRGYLDTAHLVQFYGAVLTIYSLGHLSSDRIANPEPVQARRFRNSLNGRHIAHSAAQCFEVGAQDSEPPVEVNFLAQEAAGLDPAIHSQPPTRSSDDVAHNKSIAI